jgi:thymidylate synthase
MRQYKELLQHVLDDGTFHSDRTGVGTKSVFGYQNRYPLILFPILTTKKVPFGLVVSELLWFISGSTNNANLLLYNNTIWNEWSSEEKCAKFGRNQNDLGPVYGHMWRNFGAYYNKHFIKEKEYFSENEKKYITPGFEDNGVDQLKWLINEIQINPNSRRLIITGWDPSQQGKVALPPCHTMFQFYVRDGYISCNLMQRSADSFLGVPFNISSYALLTCMIAHVCDLKPKEFIHSFGDLHIYNNHFPQVLELLSRECKQLPKLVLNPDLKNTGFEGLLKFKQEDISLVGYDPHPAIKAEVAI